MKGQDKKMRKTYRTTNWSEYNASLKARGSLTVWLDKEMQWLAQPNGKRGRNQTFSDAAIQFCLSIKCLFGQPLRQQSGHGAKPVEAGQVGLAGTRLQHGEPAP